MVAELDRLSLPPGLLDAARSVIESAGSRFELDDLRNAPPAIEVVSTITLSPPQQVAVDRLIGHDHAVLVAPTGAGKTVMACAVIAAHRVPTLILVDRTALVEQWKSRLMEHLGLGRRQIGRVAATAKSSGIIDIATLQAVARRTALQLDELPNGSSPRRSKSKSCSTPSPIIEVAPRACGKLSTQNGLHPPSAIRSLRRLAGLWSASDDATAHGREVCGRPGRSGTP